ncbi:MAG: 2-vinyl bacteriochlorophyllide hydratase [Limnohabitans sp.]
MPATPSTGLYTPAQRARRDATVWTPVQGVLAPFQFGVFLLSLGLVLYSLRTGQATDWALASVVAKTLLLYAIMVTGCIWEKVVFGQYLFASAFFWEDVVSMVVLALHTAYLVVWMQGRWSAAEQLNLALAAYATYAFNALQYLRKLRMARLQAQGQAATTKGLGPQGALP